MFWDKGMVQFMSKLEQTIIEFETMFVCMFVAGS